MEHTTSEAPGFQTELLTNRSAADGSSRHVARWVHAILTKSGDSILDGDTISGRAWKRSVGMDP